MTFCRKSKTVLKNCLCIEVGIHCTSINCQNNPTTVKAICSLLYDARNALIRLRCENYQSLKIRTFTWKKYI